MLCRSCGLGLRTARWTFGAEEEANTLAGTLLGAGIFELLAEECGELVHDVINALAINRPYLIEHIRERDFDLCEILLLEQLAKEFKQVNPPPIEKNSPFRGNAPPA